METMRCLSAEAPNIERLKKPEPSSRENVVRAFVRIAAA
jgi:hypothetical protein